MHFAIRIGVLALAATLLLTACTAPKTSPPVTDSQAANQTNPKNLSNSATTLFPREDREMTFSVWDVSSTGMTTHTEDQIRDGNRLIVVYDGKPYFTWLIEDTGIWRFDPKGDGVLLRYLPGVLKDGETWRQESGGTSVWFHLARLDFPCPVSGPVLANQRPGWELTVLNRGELTTYCMAEEVGPTLVRSDNLPQPSGSFYKEIQSNNLAAIQQAERSALLTQQPVPGGPRAEIIPESADAFDQALASLPGMARVTGDFDGDGRAEVLKGLLGTPTLSSLTISPEGGEPRTVGFSGPELHIFQPVQFDASPRMFVEVQTRRPAQSFATFTIAVATRSGDFWGLMSTSGWDFKSLETPATSVTLRRDGRITVEWNLNDPARHTRVREYLFHPDSQGPNATLESEKIRPEGQELLYPLNSQDLLQAAWLANWYGLERELSAYFSSSGEADSFHTNFQIHIADARPGPALLAAITGKTQSCELTWDPVHPKADGTAPFLLNWGGPHWHGYAWGTAVFSKDAFGKPLIQKLVVEGRCES